MFFGGLFLGQCGLGQCEMSDGGNIQNNILAMRMISLKGFKSYEDETLNNLHPRINVLLGRNGQGKSNFFKAINFVLTDRVTCNRNEFNSYTHRGLDNTPQTITVETYLQNQTSQQLICINRKWTPDFKEVFTVEGNTFQKMEMENFLQSLGIAFSNPYHIVQQGRIDSIVRMDDYELYGLLEDATGLRIYERKHEETMTNMRRITLQKEEIETVMGEIEAKLKAYQLKKEEYELHNCQQLMQKLRSKQEYESQLEINTRKLEKARQDQHGLSEELGRLRNKAKDLRQELEQLQQDIAINQRQISECEVNPEDDDLQNAPIASQQLQDINTRFKRTVQAKQKCTKEWQRKNKQTQAARKDVQAYKARFSVMTAQVEAQKLAKSSKGKAEAKGRIDRLQQNIRETDEDIRKMNAYLKEFKVQNGTREAGEAASLKEKLVTLGMQLKAAKMKMFEQNRVKNQLQAEIQALGQQSSAYMHRLKKALPLLDLGLLRQLRKQKVSGVLGYLIQFVEIEPSVAFAYEMAGASRLCTLLVQEQSVCARVIEINRRMKGKQVNMLPVSVLRRQPTQKYNMPMSRDCHGLINEEWLRVKQHDLGEDFDRQVKKLLNNTFGKYVLVENYELALEVSKRYSINCITGEREVVYSQGYFCKVGRDEAQQDRLQVYYKHEEKERMIAKAQVKLADSGKQLQALQNVELQLNKKKVALESDSANLERKLDEIAYQKRAVAKVQEQIQNLQRKKGAYEAELKRSQQILAAIENKKVQPVNQSQFKQIQQQYNQRQNAYNLRTEEEYAIQQRLTVLARQEQALAEQAAKIKQDVDFNKSFSAGYVNQRQYRTRLEQILQERQARALILQKQIFASGQDIADRQAAIESVLAQLGLANQQASYYQAQLSELGTIQAKLEQVQQRSNSLSMSFSRVHGKKRHFYSAKEKLLFNRLTELKKQFEEKRREYHKMLEIENSLNRMIDDCQRQKDEQTTVIFNKFQVHFSAIFRAITGGKSDVRLKRNKETGANRGKFRTALSILVSFEAEREVSRRWNQFSGGQKSVLAFCVLMALQKCQPAIFYVLDEVDAALDPIYLQRIVEFVRNQSAHSQYFISTFKKEMLEFPEEACSYYLVQMENRVSHISRISKEQARNSITAINQ